MSDETNSTFEREILQRLTRVETKLDLQLNARDTAIEALASTKSAHMRLDELHANQTWIWRTVIAALIVAVITFVIKGGHY